MKSTLLSLGLTEGEVTVYLTLLKKGSLTNGAIAKYAKLQSSSTYYCLNSLLEKGFVSYTLSGRVKTFTAVDPSIIPNFLDEKHAIIEKQKQAIANIMPQLQSLQSTATDTIAEVFQGIAGFKSLFSHILATLQPGDSYQAFVVPHSKSDAPIAQVFMHHNKAIHKKKITLQLLCPKELQSVMESVYGTDFLKKYQKVKYAFESIPVGITIYQEYVIMHVFDEQLTSIRIKNAALAKRYKTHFLEVWKKN